MDCRGILTVNLHFRPVLVLSTLELVLGDYELVDVCLTEVGIGVAVAPVIVIVRHLGNDQTSNLHLDPLVNVRDGAVVMRTVLCSSVDLPDIALDSYAYSPSPFGPTLVLRVE